MTISISIVTTNYKMKEVQRVTTQATLSAETGLNDIVEDVQLVCQDKLEEAYTATLTQSNGLTDDALDNNFADDYINRLYNYYVTNNVNDALSSYILQENTEALGTARIGKNYESKTFTIYNVGVKYSNATSGTEETVVTDLVITAPSLFGNLQTENMLVNSYAQYVLVTDKSVNFSNDSTSAVRGNVYAGGETEEGKYDESLNIGKESDATVNIYTDSMTTRGDIVTWGNNSKLTIEPNQNSISNVYTRNIITSKRATSSIVQEHRDVLETHSNIYARGDLLLNQPYCDVKLNGNYIGFSTNKSTDLEQKEVLAKYGAKVGSSICVNASNVNADLSGLNKLLLNGTSYLDIPVGENIENVLTGDSLTGKFSQSIYMIPASIVYYVDGDTKTLIGNPCKTSYLNLASESNTDNKYIYIDYNEFTEKTGIDIAEYVNTETPQQQKVPIYKEGASVVDNSMMYLYFNFAKNDSGVGDSESNAARYLQAYNRYFNEYLDDRAKSFNYGEIRLANNSNIFTVGNVITNKNGQITVKPNTSSDNYLLLLSEEQKDTNEYNSLASTLLSYAYTGVSTYTDSLFDYVINTEKIDSPEEAKIIINTDKVLQKLKVIIYRPQISSIAELTSQFCPTPLMILLLHTLKMPRQHKGSLYSAIVSKGDITIKTGTSYGIIITEGKVTVNPGVDFHGVIVAKEGIDVVGDASFNNEGYNSPALLWFLDTYINKDLIRENFRALSTIDKQVDNQSVDIKFDNRVVY